MEAANGWCHEQLQPIVDYFIVNPYAFEMLYTECEVSNAADLPSILQTVEMNVWMLSILD